jgi:hypothetical protein
MTRNQLKSLTFDETAMLWGIVNIVNPPVMAGYQMDPSLFPSINHKMLMDRVMQCRKYLKEENQVIFDGLVNKLKVS